MISYYSDRLTVVIRDDAPLIHAGDTPSYRSIHIALTHDQMQQINLRGDESISKIFLEPDMREQPRPGK